MKPRPHVASDDSHGDGVHVDRPWRLTVVCVFAVILVAQGFFSFVIKPEPYPSIRMPNFGTAASSDGTFDVPLARAEVVNEDGSVEAISPTALMAEFRFSTARPSYDYLFQRSEPSKITPEVRRWLRERIADIAADTHPAELRMCWQKSSVSLSDASVVRSESCQWKVVTL